MGTFYLKGNRQMVQGIPVNRLGGGGSGSGTVGPGTINEIAYFDTATTVNSLTTATYPSLTELSYVKGVTSSIQTQLNAKFTLPSLTSGSVLFSNGTTIAQDNANFFWDDTNNRLGIGTNSPTEKLHINSASGNSKILVQVAGGASTVLNLQSHTNIWSLGHQNTFHSGNLMLNFGGTDYTSNALEVTTTGKFGFGTASPAEAIHLYAPSGDRKILSEVVGGATTAFILKGASTYWNIAMNSAFHSGNLLITNDNTFTTNAIEVSTTNRVGIGITSPTAVLHLKAGTATANTAPLKFESGTNLTTAEAGAMEYNGTSLMFTPSSAVRHGLIMGNTTNSNVFSQYLKGATAFSTGTGNTLIGDSAGAALTSGLNNVLLGYVAGNTLTNGNNNQFIGAGAGQAVGAGTVYSTLIGTGAGGGSGSLDQVTFIGWGAGYSTYASYSQFIGSAAGYYATNATYSVFIGHGTGHTASSADHSVFLGVQAGDHATSAGYSEFIGTQAGYYATNASHGFFGGYQAGYGATDANNSVFIGQTAGRNATGAVESIFIGKGSGYNAVSTGVLGDYNTGLGTDTLKALTTGAGNIALGYKVGDTITTGSKNVAIGYDIDYQSNTTDGQLTIQNAIFGTGNTGTGTTASTGAIGIFVPAPSARLHLVAGETGANKAPLKFNTGSFNTTAEAGAVEFLAERFTVTPTSTARQAVSGVLFTQTADATVANTVTETALIGTGVAVGGGLTLPANFFVAGKTIRLFVRGFHSSTGNPNITLRVKLGGTTVMATATTPSGNGSNDGFVLFGDITCRTTGGTGTVFGQGQYLELHSGGITEGLVSTAAVTVDTTTALAVSATIEWGTADAGNTITSTNATLEVLN